MKLANAIFAAYIKSRKANIFIVQINICFLRN